MDRYSRYFFHFFLFFVSLFLRVSGRFLGDEYNYLRKEMTKLFDKFQKYWEKERGARRKEIGEKTDLSFEKNAAMDVAFYKGVYKRWVGFVDYLMTAVQFPPVFCFSFVFFYVQNGKNIVRCGHAGRSTRNLPGRDLHIVRN